MARKKHHEEPAPEMINGNVALPVELQEIPKAIEILDAVIKDDFCHYTYKYLTGVEKGNKQKSNSIYVITDDMKKAFARFNVHLAAIDDLFKNAKIEVDDIDKFHDHEFTYLMTTTGFKIIGDEDNQGIILIGHKFVSGGGRIGIETYKIMLDSLSSYMWRNELKDVADKARLEVELYKAGKYVPPEEEDDDVEEDEKPKKKKQTKMTFEQPQEAVDEEAKGGDFTDKEFEDDFSKAEL